jgi:hypothetical protein
VIRLSSITIYPIKSLGPVSLEEAVVEPRGLRDDRRMMMVDPDGKFITQRQHAGLALFRVKPHAEGWELSHPDHGSCLVPREPGGGRLDVVVWKSDVSARLVDPTVDAWLSKATGLSVRLVAMDDESHRPCGEGEVSFADGYPVLLIGEASLAELNRRVGEGLSMRRFRTNLTTTGGNPHDEDAARWVRLSGAEFENVKPCGRCIVTTLDPDTGEGGVEPLQTLATYRKEGQSVNFGVNLVPTRLGTVRVGDLVNFER